MTREQTEREQKEIARLAMYHARRASAVLVGMEERAAEEPDGRIATSELSGLTGVASAHAQTALALSTLLIPTSTGPS